MTRAVHIHKPSCLVLLCTLIDLPLEALPTIDTIKSKTISCYSVQHQRLDIANFTNSSSFMALRFPKKHLDSIQAMDLEDAHTLPACMYTDEAFVQLDQGILLANSWQLVAHISQLSKPGDHVVSEVGKNPILIVRNKTGQIKGFHNVCRHRAGPIATTNGNRPQLSCRYHGWTYDLDGQLTSAPEMTTTPNFDVCQHHLPPVSLSTWQGLIFANVAKASEGIEAAAPAELSTVMAGIAETIAPVDLSSWTFSHRQEYLIQCNWKAYMDNYLEGYHLPIVHPGLNKLLDYRSYEITLAPWYSYQYSPLEDTAADKNFYGSGKAHYFCVFPNLMLNILPGRLQTNVVTPLTKNTCKVVFESYYPDINSAASQKMIAQDLAFSDEIQAEDIAICEAVQKGLASGTYESGRLNMKRENAVFHYQEIIRQSYRAAIANKLLSLDDN